MDPDKLASLCAWITANDPLGDSCLDIGFTKAGNVDLQLLCDALATNTVINTLRMECNSITDGEPITRLLRQNHTLSAIHVGGRNDINAVTFGNWLRVDGFLTFLSLFGSEIDDEDVGFIASALRTNCSLTRLELGDNLILDRGLSALVASLRMNNSLRYLGLMRNGFGDSGAKMLASMVAENRTLEWLAMHSNAHITVEGYYAMVDALESNTVLLGLDTDWYCERLRQYLARNHVAFVQRKKRCRLLIIALLGVRKLYRCHSGIWTNCPREVMHMISIMIWKMRNLSDWADCRK